MADSPRRYVEERIYLPAGLDWDRYEALSFQVGVFYRGCDRWMVANDREGNRQLTRTGRWLWRPLKMTAMRWCRFPFEEACALAERHVDSVKVNGRTWAEWTEWEARNG